MALSWESQHRTHSSDALVSRGSPKPSKWIWAHRGITESCVSLICACLRRQSSMLTWRHLVECNANLCYRKCNKQHPPSVHSSIHPSPRERDGWVDRCHALHGKHNLTRKWRCCSSVRCSCGTGDGLRPGWGVTCAPGSFSSPGVFSRLVGASFKSTHGVSPTTWWGRRIQLHFQNPQCLCCHY